MNSKIVLPALVTALICFLGIPAIAQDAATMTAPIVRAAEGEVIFSVRISGLASGKQYRLGLGTVKDTAPKATLELSKDDAPVSAEATTFTQQNTSDWWGVDKLEASGFVLQGSLIPAAGEELNLKVSVPKELADTYQKLFLFVSRDYGGGTWYLEDGVVLDSSYW